MINNVLRDPRLQTLLALILLDLILGIAGALKTGVFKWEEIGRFYKTTVLPIFIGYGAILAALPYISVGLLGEGGQWLTELLATAFWLTGVGTLLSSIKGSIDTLGVDLPF